MGQLTNLNIAPYYDDFDESDNFHRVLYRPSFAVQARELTTQQSILQDQIEKLGKNIFKEGAQVIPGEVGFTDEYYAVKLNSTFAGSDISSYLNTYVDSVITGASSGVQAQVITVAAADSSSSAELSGGDPITLFVKYIRTGNDKVAEVFQNGENISADVAVGSFVIDQESATVQATDGTATGSSAYVNAGVYFIRGTFVRNSAQRLVLDKYTNTPSYRVGFTITETLVTPENDTSLLDNATGSSNENAKGAHRLKVALTLAKLSLNSTADSNFIELLRVKEGVLQFKARDTEYSILGDTLARRTFDESGHYSLSDRQFQVVPKENLTDGLNEGIYSSGAITDSGNTASNTLMTLQVSPGKAYVKGYELEKIAPSFVDIEKPRTTRNINAGITPVEVGNFVRTTNLFQIPDLTPEISGEIAKPYREVSLHDNFTAAKSGGSAARGTEAGSLLPSGSAGTKIGNARIRAIELDSNNSSVTNFLSTAADNDTQYKINLFDIKMITELVMSATPSGGLNTGAKVTGVTSGATGFVDNTSGNRINLISVTGTFTNGEKVKSTSSAETDEIVEDSGNTDLTIASSQLFDFSMVHSMFMNDPDAGEDFTCDTVQESTFTLTGTVSTEPNNKTLTGFGTLFTTELRVGDAIEIPSGNNGVAEKIVVEAITSNTQLTYYVLEGFDDVTTSNTTRTSTTATITSTGAFASGSGTILPGSGSRTVIIKGHNASNYNGKFTLTRTGDNTATYTVAGSPTTPDTSSGTAAIVTLTNSITTVPATRTRTVLKDQDRNILIRKLQKPFCKTLLTDSNNGVSDTSFTFRRQFIVTVNSSGQISMTAGSNETFNAFNNTDYVISILDQGGAGGTGRTGDIVDIDGSNVTTSGSGSSSATITSTTVFGSSGDYKVKVVATLTKTSVQQNTKTNNAMHLIDVDNDGVAGAAIYGTSAHHKEISLGRGDVYNLRAIFESAASGTDVTLPQFTATSFIGTFTKGERIIGGTSGAIGEIIHLVSPITYVLKSNTDFSAGETITGQTSGATAVVGTLTAGDNDVTANYTLDDGMRDNFYDIARIVRKQNAPQAIGKLLIVCDYFDHGNGEFFTVDSYSGIDYEDIPDFVATRIDPTQRRPAGLFKLHDCVDFRPKVANATITTSTRQGESIDKVTSASFDFNSRTFTGTGSSVVNIPKDNSNFQYDLDFFLARNDILYLNYLGEFVVKAGIPDEESIVKFPKELSQNEHMKIAEIVIPPFVKDVKKVRIFKERNRRYTMRDIGKLEDRIERVEDFTTLNLLEQEAETLQILDAAGLNRFKTGFVVDNFSGHKTGFVTHSDYNCAIDYENGELRPSYVQKGISLLEKNDTDTLRANNNYAKTGDLITLPYTHEVVIEQPYATRIENVNTMLFYQWIGDMKLDPSGDEWFEVNRLPAIIINLEGNFNQFENAANERNALGTVWNAWETTWSGRRVFGRNRGRTGQLIESTTTNQVRSGQRTFVREVFVDEVIGTEIVRQDLIPFIRARNVTFKVDGMYPKMRVYPFFDKSAVTNFVDIDGGSINGTATTIALPSTAGNYTSISRVDFKFDNNAPIDIVAELFSSDRANGTYTSHGQKTVTAASNTTYSYTGLTITPNNEGETFIKIDVGEHIGEDCNIFGTNRLYSVEFYDQAGALIDNSQNATVEFFKNFTNPMNALRTETPPLSATVPETRDSSAKIIFNLFNGPRTVTPASGTVDKILPGNEDMKQFVTGPTGSIRGIFSIPDPTVAGNPAFLTGERVFRLSSSETNAIENVRTHAQSIYRARGILNTVVETVTRTRNGEVVTETVEGNRQLNSQRIIRQWRLGGDPLAQSFAVQEIGGAFVTKLDLFFQKKDTDIPITIELREMENGYPTKKVLPFGRKTLQPEDVNVSEDATAVTTFTFDAPIYLQEGREYCFVLLADSKNYLQWISQMGELDVGGSRLVNDQPFLGALFKSQNDSTYTGFQFQDMKFNLYRAKFTTTSSGNIELHNEPVPSQTLQLNPIETLNTSTTVKILHPDHGMHTTSNNVTISGASSGVSTTLSAQLLAGGSSLSLASSTGFPGSGTVHLKISRPNDSAGDPQTAEVVSGTISGTTVSSLTRGVEGADAQHESGATVELYQVSGIPLTQINKTHTAIANIQLDSYTITTTASATSTAKVGGNAVVATENAMMDLANISVNTVEYPNTKISSSLKTSTGTSVNGAQTSFTLTTLGENFGINENIFFETPRMIASEINEANEMSSSKSFQLTLAFTSEFDNLSPVLDMDRGSVFCIGNRVDNIDSASDVYPTSDFIDPTESEGDNTNAIYLTKQIVLNSPATQINVKFDAVRLPNSEIQVMFKTLRSDDSSDFNDLGYTFFNTNGTTDVTTNTSTTRDDFIEHEYSATDLQEFISFQIKIRMQSTDSTRPPVIKRLRAIATA